MIPRQIRLVQRSFALIEPYADQVGMAFYEKLFERVPELRPSFPSDIDVQQRKLMSFLGAFVKLQLRSLLTLPVTASRELEVTVPGIAELVEDHAQFGFDIDHFVPAREALLASIGDQLGGQFDEATAKAWSAAFDMISESMIRVMRGEAQDAADYEAASAHVETDPRALESLFRN